MTRHDSAPHGWTGLVLGTTLVVMALVAGLNSTFMVAVMPNLAGVDDHTFVTGATVANTGDLPFPSLGPACTDHPQGRLHLAGPGVGGEPGQRVPVGQVELEPGGRADHPGQVFVQQPRLTSPDMHGLEHTVAA